MPEPGLEQVFRVRDGLAIGLGPLIGVGVVRTPGVAAGYLGKRWTILAVWLIGGVVAALSAPLLSEMAATLPRAGGKHVYGREAFGPVPAPGRACS